MRYHLSADDFDDVPALTPVAACSVERMLRPDHKAKKHGRPLPGRGHDRFRRHRCAIEELNAWGEMRNARERT